MTSSGIPASIGRRPAAARDMDFLYHLHVATMKEYVERTWGWDESFQTAYFRSHFDPAGVHIVTIAGSDAGMLSVEDKPDYVFLRSIEIAPDFQDRGIGSVLIKELIAEGLARSKPTYLRVLKVNPARRLYERLGFKVIGESDTHFQMSTTLPGSAGK